jgi:hypothetical protein
MAANYLYEYYQIIALYILGSVSSNGFHNNKNQFTAYAAYTRALPTTGVPTLIDPNLKA